MGVGFSPAAILLPGAPVGGVQVRDRGGFREHGGGAGGEAVRGGGGAGGGSGVRGLSVQNRGRGRG